MGMMRIKITVVDDINNIDSSVSNEGNQKEIIKYLQTKLPLLK
jgi:hypothetical protein